MKKKTILLVIIGILLVGAAVYFFLIKNDSSPLLPGNTEEETSFTGSMKDLLLGGKAQKCTYMGEDGEGTVYVASDSRVRADFTSTVDEETRVMHTIVDKDTSYIWTDGEATGIKVTIDTSKPSEGPEEDSNSEEQSAESNGINAKNNYKCGLWLVDASKFDLPEGVQFQSMEDLFKSFTPQGIPTPSSE